MRPQILPILRWPEDIADACHGVERRIYTEPEAFNIFRLVVTGEEGVDRLDRAHHLPSLKQELLLEDPNKLTTQFCWRHFIPSGVGYPDKFRRRQTWRCPCP